MECKQSQSLLSDYIDNRLDEATVQQLENHLERCVPCKSAVDELDSTVALLQSLPQLSAPPELAQNIFNAIDELESAHRKPRYFWRHLAAAAVLLFCVAIGSYAVWPFARQSMIGDVAMEKSAPAGDVTFLDNANVPAKNEVSQQRLREVAERQSGVTTNDPVIAPVPSEDKEGIDSQVMDEEDEFAAEEPALELEQEMQQFSPEQPEQGRRDFLVENDKGLHTSAKDNSAGKKPSMVAVETLLRSHQQKSVSRGNDSLDQKIIGLARGKYTPPGDWLPSLSIWEKYFDISATLSHDQPTIFVVEVIQDKSPPIVVVEVISREARRIRSDLGAIFNRPETMQRASWQNRATIFAHWQVPATATQLVEILQRLSKFAVGLGRAVRIESSPVQLHVILLQAIE